jgi:uncharacterized protein
LEPATARPADRVRSLDILRGFALLGMILVHVHQHLERSTTGLEDLISWIIWVGVEQKSWATFALLFGIGFAIQLRRMEKRGVRVTPVYLRRLLGLALFGIVAYVCFGFRILLDYAFWGVPLLFMRRWSTRSLLLAALISASAQSLVYFGIGTYQWVTLGRSAADSAAEARGARIGQARAELKAAEQQPAYGVLVRARLDAMRADYLNWRLLVPGANLTLFILGYLALRHGVIDTPQRHTRLIVVAMALGLLSWAVWWLVLRNLQITGAPRTLAAELQSGLGIVYEQWLAFFYVGGLILLLAHRPIWEQRFAPMGLAGRMALTNYFIQIALLDLLSSGYGLHLQVRATLVPMLAATIFGLEVAISRFWLRRFRLGPAEWLWRSFTYGAAQPLRAPLT